MPSSHLIRLLPGGATEWLALDRDGRVLSGPVAGLPGGASEGVTVCVPSSDVLLLRTPRIARQRRQLEQAVPFAIEEQLAAPIEQMHVAIADDERAADIIVAVVARAQMDAWLQPLLAAGLQPDRLLPESWLLPLPADGAILLCDGERATLRHAQAGVLAGATSEVPAWLQLLDAAQRPPVSLRQVGDRIALPATLPSTHEATGPVTRWLAAQLGAAPGLNLLQGTYAPHRRRGDAVRLWRWAASVAFAAVLAGLAYVVVERHELQQRNAAQRAEMEQLLRAALPDVTRVVDPKAQLTAAYARLGSGRGGADALPLLARIAPSIAGSGRYSIDGIDYRAGILDLIVRADDIAALDSLRETLAALPQLQVELTSANPGVGGMEGRLRIRERGA